VKPSNADIRRLLSRVENTLGEEDRLILETLLDDVTESVESRMIRVLSDISGVVARSSAAAEQMTAVTERVVALLERDLGQCEAQTAALKEANALTQLQVAQQHELRMTWLQRVGVPALTGIVSALVSGAATFVTMGSSP
jgi:hypothetical protein